MPVPDGVRQRVQVDDLVAVRLVRGGGESDDHLGVEFADGLGERGSAIAVLLIGEHDQVLALGEPFVQRAAQRLLKLVGGAAVAGGRRQRLHGEDVELGLGGILHRRAGIRGVEVL